MSTGHVSQLQLSCAMAPRLLAAAALVTRGRGGLYAAAAALPLAGLIHSLLRSRWVASALSRARIWTRMRLFSLGPPSFSIASVKHRRWVQPVLEASGWRAGAPTTATFAWHLVKRLLPKAPSQALAFNCLPNLLLLDDKAVLALLSRRFHRTRPLATHVIYGEWDGTRTPSNPPLSSSPAHVWLHVLCGYTQTRV